MRLVVGLFAMFLTASVARAEEPKAPEPKAEVGRSRVGLRVVRMLPESHQALLFDKNHGTHVLAAVGETVGGYLVEDIDDDEVTLSAAGKEIVLAAPEPRSRRQGSRPVADADPAVAPSPASRGPQPLAATPETANPVDPYAEPGATPATAAGATTPVDPYDDAPVRPVRPVRVVDAPRVIEAGEGGIRVANANPGTAAAPSSPPVPGSTATAPTNPTTAPIAPTTPAAPVITPTVLSRSELNAALADFTRLTGLLRGSFTPAGARLELVLDGSVFAKAGLRAGDVVTSVDNTPLKTLDDAADLFARASTTRAANISLVRAGKPLTLRVLFQ